VTVGTRPPHEFGACAVAPVAQQFGGRHCLSGVDAAQRLAGGDGMGVLLK